MSNKPGSVLVVGAGVAGIRAAFDMAQLGHKVFLCENSEQIGGILAKLDHQFPNNHCGMCRMLPTVGREVASEHCLRKSVFHENIEILPFTELTSIEGDAGAFKVSLLRRARHVNPEICNGLGECIEACPIEMPDAFNGGLTMRKAIYRPVPHNVPQLLLVDTEACDKCGKCVAVCPSGAIDLDAEDQPRDIEVGAIILASGASLYDINTADDAKSWNVSDDVVDSLTYERLISGSGTYHGKILRPSDGKEAKRIAWIQCMGSRNRRQGRDYCSSICCMFALKEAVLAKQKGGADTDTTIFYMDMRTYGKGFYRYRESAEEEGVRLVRCRVQEVYCEADGTLVVRYFDPKTGEFAIGEYDLVVMSTGQAPFESHKELAALLKLELTETGLLPAVDFDKVRLLKPGVFMCGSVMGLTDISEAVTSGTAAAGAASQMLISKNMGPEEPDEADAPPPEREAEGQRPSVCVILCRHKIPGAETILNLDSLHEKVGKLFGVNEVKAIDSLCHEDGAQELKKVLAESKCNRVLIGACLPQVYRQTFRKMARAAGFNESLVEIIDVLGFARQASAGNEEAWANRALGEIRANVEKLKQATPLHAEILPIEQCALVAGGGLAGLRAALSLADRGVKVVLMEKSAELGGHAVKVLKYTATGADPVALCKDMIERVKEHKKITVHTNCEVVGNRGTLGSFTVAIKRVDTDEPPFAVSVGAVILATGGREGRTAEYRYGGSKNIVTQVEFETQLSDGKIDPATLQHVAMIQCVGSREKGGREYCSRICCSAAMKNALKIKEKNPDTRVYVLYRDIMTYGFLERFYSQARAAGVIFINYELDNKPKVDIVDDKPVLTFTDPILRSEMQLPADLLVLATGIDPSKGNKALANAFGLTLTADGFFQEADSKWRPIESERPGVYIAGMAHTPQLIDETLMQAEAAAHKAFTHLARKTMSVARVVSIVHDAFCTRCKRCIDVCPYDARSFDSVNNCIVVDQAACQACGMCAAVCPNSAAEVPGWNEKQIMAVLDAKLSDCRPMATV